MTETRINAGFTEAWRYGDPELRANAGFVEVWIALNSAGISTRVKEAFVEVWVEPAASAAPRRRRVVVLA